MGDILSNLFSGWRGGEAPTSGGGRRARSRPQRGRDLETEVRISFDQSISGAQIPLSVPTSSVCSTCHGTGAKPGTTPKVCPRCEGRGIESEGQGMFSITQPCSLCGGSGTVIEDPCPTCRGSGAVRTVKKFRVNIPAGVKEGSRIRVPGKGESGARGGPAGDLYVVTHVDPSPAFKRKGDNLEVEVPLDDPRGAARRRGARADARRLQDSAREARYPPRSAPAPARRGSAQARQQEPRATSTTASRSTCPSSSPTSSAPPWTSSRRS